jgi:hypothetical protein
VKLFAFGETAKNKRNYGHEGEVAPALKGGVREKRVKIKE